MKDLDRRLGFIVPKGTYPTVMDDNTFSYYEQICALVTVIGELNTEINTAVGTIGEIDTRFTILNDMILELQRYVNAQLALKQDLLTFDNHPTQGSTNPVTSTGIYGSLADKQDVLTFDNRPRENSTNPVTSHGIFNALADKQDSLVFDNSPRQNSDNPVKSGGIFSFVKDIQGTLETAIAAKQNALTFDTVPTDGSTNPVTSDGIYDYIQTVIGQGGTGINNIKVYNYANVSTNPTYQEISTDFMAGIVTLFWRGTASTYFIFYPTALTAVGMLYEARWIDAGALKVSTFRIDGNGYSAPVNYTIQQQHITATATIAVADWQLSNGVYSASISVQGVTADNTVFIEHSIITQAITATQSANTLTFTTNSLPDDPDNIKVVILP